MRKMIAFLLACLMAISMTTIAFAEETPTDDISIGSILAFGNYEQDADESNGKEPIEWVVLDKKDNHALLLSRYILDTHQYHNINTTITWEKCELRNWLNTSFYQDSFSEKERDVILLTRVDNGEDKGDSVYSIANSGESTEDYIFLLSSQEAFKYFGSDYFRAAKATDYAIQNRAVIGGENRSEWYLRSPAFKGNQVCTVNNTGMPCVVDVNHWGNLEGDRPAMWVDTSAKGFQTAELLDDNFFTEYYEWVDNYERPKNDIVGSIVQFGHYEQDADAGNGLEPIEWIIVDAEDDHCLLVSKHILDRHQFNSNSTPTDWELSDVRKWLNETFLNTAFDEKEQKAIVVAVVDNSLSQGGYFSDGGNNTEDQVFLLSYMEATKYFPTDESRACSLTPYALSVENDDYAGWWNRSPYMWNSKAYLLETGDVGVRGFMRATYKSGIRPAVWVTTDALGL